MCKNNILHIRSLNGYYPGFSGEYEYSFYVPDGKRYIKAHKTIGFSSDFQAGKEPTRTAGCRITSSNQLAALSLETNSAPGLRANPSKLSVLALWATR